MGAISGEELLKWEKMQGMGAREEKILVLVRLRPLSEKEAVANEVADWECINDTTILYRNTLREGSTFPYTYTFDRVYRGDCSTREVYEEGARGLALSVVNGINSSIFAYGQTSSGKTYTMNGITELTVADIFDYVHKHEERAFVLKFSAIEIYNEVVRDLLSTDSTSLRLLDDPERGTIVEKVTEETLRDWNHFNELVSICEAQRQIGETLLNERSSRSHQILKLTVESSAREFLGKDNSTTLSASVNFVDLAGSERASQALSAGTRLKEGCHINRSLLTLGTVIRKLSKGRHGHINYRDSKLTRILQPALGGNARTAIICTLSPARSHVEQTRNTLLFACCAKEVTTKAQVNVVMSDKALVKHLQKELARLESELRAPGPISSNCDYVALLKKKDLQIEKMEKEIRDLKKQRDGAQSRVEELLKLVENDQDPKPLIGNGHQSNGKTDDTWEDDCSLSDGITYSHSLGSSVRKMNGTMHHKKMNGNNSEQRNNSLWENTEEHSEADNIYSPQSVGQGYDEYCKDVQCVDMEVSSRENNVEALSSPLGENAVSALRRAEDHEGTGQTSSSTAFSESGGRSHIQNLFRYNDHGDTSPQAPEADISSSTNLKLSRGLSCRANPVTGSSPSFEEADVNTTPPNEFERVFPGRPEALQGAFEAFLSWTRRNPKSRNSTPPLSLSLSPSPPSSTESLEKNKNQTFPTFACSDLQQPATQGARETTAAAASSPWNAFRPNQEMAYVDHAFSISDEDMMMETTYTVNNRPPIKEIALAVSLLVFGSIGIVLGIIMASYKVGGDRAHGVFFTMLGSILFIPGFYYTRIAYYAYKGYKGFSFSNIPPV